MTEGILSFKVKALLLSVVDTVSDLVDSVAAVDAEELSLLLQLLLYSSGSLCWFML